MQEGTSKVTIFKHDTKDGNTLENDNEKAAAFLMQLDEDLKPQKKSNEERLAEMKKEQKEMWKQFRAIQDKIPDKGGKTQKGQGSESAKLKQLEELKKLMLSLQDSG